MVQILHGCAKTTYAIREELQRSKASISELSKRYNINHKTVIKWRRRKEEGVADKSNAPKKTNTVLNSKDEAIIIAFRKSTRLALDDCYDALIEDIPHLTRSNLYRCLYRHGLSRLPKEEEIKEKKKFKAYDIGYMHVDITEVQVEKQKLYIYVAICRVSKFVYAEIHNNKTVENACAFTDNLVAACPFKIHTITAVNSFIQGLTYLRKSNQDINLLLNV